MVCDSVTKLTVKSCELCNADGGEFLWRDNVCRVVQVDDADYPGFCRVILFDHVSEMSELDIPTRDRLMQVVFATEFAVREIMRPIKINLASLGNSVPHLHWHVIPRFVEDRHFPSPIWAAARRERAVAPNQPDARMLSTRLASALVKRN